MKNTNQNDTLQYTVSISPVLHNKLDQHIYVLKKLIKPKLTKKDWVAEAVEQKLARDDSKQDLPKVKRICIKIDHLTKGILDNLVDMVRSLRNSYSKKQWILDAIQEKLAQEEGAVKNKLKELMKPTIANNAGKLNEKRRSKR